MGEKKGLFGGNAKIKGTKVELDPSAKRVSFGLSAAISAELFKRLTVKRIDMTSGGKTGSNLVDHHSEDLSFTLNGTPYVVSLCGGKTYFDAVKNLVNAIPVLETEEFQKLSDANVIKSGLLSVRDAVIAVKPVYVKPDFADSGIWHLNDGNIKADLASDRFNPDKVRPGKNGPVLRAAKKATAPVKKGK